MSTKYPGGLITKTPVTPAGPYENGAAPGVWTVEQALQYTKQGIWPTAGNQDPANLYIEYLFSTYLYTGNGSTQTITNGINLSGKGGLVWLKERSPNTTDHNLVDTSRGVTSLLFSNLSNAAQIGGSPLDSFSSTGFVTNANGNSTNSLYATWTFRKQAKFFDIVTYTGNGLSSQVISHNLGSVPGCIIVKNMTSGARDWEVFHTSLGATKSIQLNLTSAATTSIDYWNNTAPTSTQFTVGGNNTVNTDTHNYVAYLFAHDAGGFGASGTDNVISCGGTALDASGFATVSLGYEPQFVMIKSTEYQGQWAMYDTMRGAVALKSSNLYSAFSAQKLAANDSAAESTATDYVIAPSSTGFTLSATGYAGAAYDNFIYIAIRKGPMQTPTVGTSVFAPTTTATAGSPGATATTNFPVDLSIYALRDLAGLNSIFFDKLRGTRSTSSVRLVSSSTAAEASSGANGIGIQSNTTVTENWTGSTGYNNILWNFRRAPGFFDEVCYIGTGTAGQTYTHNLAAVPELMIVKGRSNVNNWRVYSSFTGATKYLNLNSVDSEQTLSSMWNDTAPTASVFTVGTNSGVNTSATTYVAYLFATCAGVSKVGTYTGTGTLTTINCGFTGGARFVLIKKSSGVGSWFIWDSARGMVSGTDPSLRLNVTDAEQSGDSIYSIATGFQLLASPFENVNTNGDTYIFLAIA